MILHHMFSILELSVGLWIFLVDNWKIFVEIKTYFLFCFDGFGPFDLGYKGVCCYLR